MAKVKQISIKALRYYEKIGILKPTYCDPDTGYRYYKNEQMLAIDMIKFLQILDIPLKTGISMWNRQASLLEGVTAGWTDPCL